MGVWIETLNFSSPDKGTLPVTPYVGVWIETLDELLFDYDKFGHSLCGSVD